MLYFKRCFDRFPHYVSDSSGASAIELGLIVGVIAVGSIVGLQALSDNLEVGYRWSSAGFQGATGSAMVEASAAIAGANGAIFLSTDSGNTEAGNVDGSGEVEVRCDRRNWEKFCETYSR